MPLTNLAPKWALSAQAIHSDGNPFLTKGNHLRLAFDAGLGLPVAPFLVHRQPLGHPEEIQAVLGLRSDVVWTDSRGALLTPPFTMPASGRVTGWLPPPDKGRCLWIQVNAVPSGDMEMIALTHDPTTLARPNIIGRTDQIPFMLAASRIDRIELHGHGTVSGVLWLDALNLVEEADPDFWRLLSLPVEGGERYVQYPLAMPEAEQRVLEGAPPRMSRPDELAPAFDPSPTPPDEFTRLGPLLPNIQEWLDQLLNDLSEPIHKLLTEHAADIPGAEPGNLDRRDIGIQTLGLLLQSSIDPGVARWLGLLATDIEDGQVQSEELVAYFVEGFFSRKAYEAYLADLEEEGGDPRLLPDHLIVDPGTVRGAYEAQGIDIDLSRLDEIDDQYINAVAVAIAIIDNAPLPPGRPMMDPPITNRPFLPAPPPTAVREVLLPANRRLEPLAGLVRRDNDGSHLLNEVSPAGRALMIVTGFIDPGLRTKEKSENELSDRSAPPEHLIYRIAHADWFGRWSPWTEVGALAKARPRPPVPAPQVTYRFIVIPDPVPGGPLSGTLRLDIPVPEPRALSPGSHLLSSVQITVHEVQRSGPEGDEVVTFTPLFTQTAPGLGEDIHAQDGNILTIEISRPEIALERATIKEVGVSARFVDQAGQMSRESDTAIIVLTDPRPPLPVDIPLVLKYTARPDATGLARVDLRWTPAPAQRRFRIFYSDEVRLLGYLESVRDDAAHPNNVAAGALLASLTPDLDQAQRAQIFKDNAQILGRTTFEQLTADPLELPQGATEMQFDHAVSGSLEVLSFYRIVAVSAANVEASFVTSAVVPVAVPNALPPNDPDLSLATVREMVDGRLLQRTDAVRLVIEVPRGPTPAAHYRLRRSQVGANTLEMPIVEEGVMPPLPDTPADPAAVMQRLEVVHSAPPLQPWRKYYWRAEVRGGPAPGAPDLVGMWSRPTQPVSAVLVPSDPPPPIESLSVAVSGQNRALFWQHPLPLDGGGVGQFRFEIFHFLPGSGWQSVGSMTAASGRATVAGPFTFVHTAAESEVFEGELYRVTLYDPLNRAAASEPVAVPMPSENMATLFSWWRPGGRRHLISSHPDWQGEIGDRQEGFQLMHIEGRLFDPDGERPEGTLPLETWEHRGNGRLITTTAPDILDRLDPSGSVNFEQIRVEGFVFDPEAPQPEGTVPLFTIVVRNRRAIVTTSDQSWFDDARNFPQGNINVMRLEGYIAIAEE